MNISEENRAIASDQQGITGMLHPRTWSIQWKVRINFLLRAVVAISLVVLMVNIFQRRSAIRDVNDKLLLLTDSKSIYIKDYFAHINQLLISFSTDRQTTEALNQLSESFLNIENDSYFTSAVTSPDKVNTLIEGFYTAEVLPVLDGFANSSVNLQTLLPSDTKQRILQYLYLASNSKPLGAKNTINRAEDGSAYSTLHALYHPDMLKFARQAGITDILLVDYKSGYVTYSMKKNLDFATNLFDGPYKNSGLGSAFKNAIGQASKGSVTYIDESHYVPALLQPCIFISAPVFNGSQLSGAVVFAINISTLDNMLVIDKEGISSGESLKAIIIGNDLLYRSNDPEFITDKARYLRKLKKYAANGEIASNAESFNSTALVQAVDPAAFADALKGKENLAEYTSETGERVLCSYMPLKINNLNWILATQMDKSKALAPVHRFIYIMIVMSLIIAVLLYYISGITTNTISDRLSRLRNNIIALSNGEKIQEITADSHDEIGQSLKAISKLSQRISEAEVFVTEMGKGNINLDFSITGDDDQYGISMVNLKKSLMLRVEEEETRKKDEEIRNWAAHGIAMFNDILRLDNNDLEKLTLNIIRNIIQYLSANQGGLFLIEEEEHAKYLNLTASYAFERQKFLKKRIEIGEGLTGTCVLEKKTILLNKIPDNYISITSGLGGSKPGCLLIVPLKKEEDVLGVLEVASFHDFKPHEVEFVEKVAESIAAALITVRLHIQTSQYLERFQQQSEEMKAQDEELRQNIEELQATHEQMERIKQEEHGRNEKMIKEMEDYRKLLLNVLDQIPGKIFVKDHDGKLLLLNSEVAKVYNKAVDDLIGTSDFDNHAIEDATVYRAKELEIIANGTETYVQEELLTGSRRFLKTTKMPFYLPHLNTTGLMGFQIDVTDAILLEEKIKQMNVEIEALRGQVKGR